MVETAQRSYRFLHLEDDPNDAELIEHILLEAGIRHTSTLVKSRSEFQRAIRSGNYDLIMSDFKIPSFSGKEALAIVQEKTPGTPFIFISGHIGEDAAIQSLHEGATDYILKTNLNRLVPAVNRAIREGEERKKLKRLEVTRKRALEELKASEARFRGLLESAPDAVIICNSRGNITFANVESERVFGYRKKELLGKPLGILVPQRFRNIHDKLVSDFNVEPHRRSLASGKDLYGLRKDGTEFPADIMLSPMKIGKELSVLAMIRDSTATKSAEIALRQSEEKFRHIYEYSPVGIISFGPEADFLWCNPAALNILGYTESELSRMQFNAISHPDDRQIGMDLLDLLRSGAKDSISYEKRYLRKDGRVVWAHRIVSAVRDSDGKLIYTISIIEDITERKKAEDALKRSEDRYRSLVDGARDAIFSLSASGIIQSLNPAFETITGWRREQWVGKSFTDLLPPEDRKGAAVAFKRLLNGEASDFKEYRIATKSGDILTLELSITMQMRDGKLTGMLGIARDVTAQKMLEEQLRQSQKMESIGTLAGGIAHDFNNILGIIVGYASLVRKSVGEDADTVKEIESIQTAAERGVDLVRQLLTFARKEERTFKSFDVNLIVSDTMKLIEQTFPKSISITLESREERLIATGDASEIHQAILNLCINARDAMVDRSDGRPSGGSLKITVNSARKHQLKDKFPAVDSDEYVVISISDTGIGMDEATKARIFEPFFTTKRRGKGTGLGLSTVYGIVEGHEGFLSVLSTPGVGTTFEVYIPRKGREEGTIVDHHPVKADVDGGTETILVVEDELALREFLTQVLKGKGYNVLAADDGQTGLAVFSTHDEISIVLSDIGLPNMSGVELLETIKKLNPAAKVILASGYVEDEEKERAIRFGVTALLPKPYQLDEVLRLVRTALDTD